MVATNCPACLSVRWSHIKGAGTGASPVCFKYRLVIPRDDVFDKRACVRFDKSGAKATALQTLTRQSMPPNLAKRLDCGAFTAAFVYGRQLGAISYRCLLTI
jgi:hypothetical protein